MMQQGRVLITVAMTIPVADYGRSWAATPRELADSVRGAVHDLHDDTGVVVSPDVHTVTIAEAF